MAGNITDRTITVLAEGADLKGQIRVEGALRGHNISEAALECIKLGLPAYLKLFPVKYEVKASPASEAKRRLA